MFIIFFGLSLACTTEYCTGSNVNIRSGPGTSYSKVGTLNKGDTVCVVSTSDGWSKLDTGNYVCSDYLATGCTTEYCTGSNVNIRSGPGTSYSKVGTLNKGDQVCVISDSNGWSLLTTGNYVSSQYLSTTPAPTPSPIPVVHTKIRDALLKSQWSAKAYALTTAYDLALNNGYSINCAVGLMANLIHEGNYGVVEYAFSKSHNYGFYLPSGSTDGKCKTIADIKYVRDWTTSDNSLKSRRQTILTLRKGSCGFGSIQWSFGRRVNFAKVCLEIMTKDSDICDSNWAIAEATYIAQELKNTYYTKVSNAAAKYSNTVEAWAEAFTDYYEVPSGCDGNMSGTGTSCKQRRATARSLYDYLDSEKAFD
jgi:uncharacterized protein YraI